MLLFRSSEALRGGIVGRGGDCRCVRLRWLAISQPAAGLASQISNGMTIFLGIFMEASAFLLFGTLASGLVETFTNQDSLARLIPRDPLRGAVVGACPGTGLPHLRVRHAPLARRMLTKGLPLPVTIAFLLAAPMFNPIVIASTLTAFGLGPVFFCRIGLTLFIGIVAGVAFLVEARPERALRRGRQRGRGA